MDEFKTRFVVLFLMVSIISIGIGTLKKTSTPRSGTPVTFSEGMARSLPEFVYADLTPTRPLIVEVNSNDIGVFNSLGLALSHGGRAGQILLQQLRSSRRNKP